MRDPESSIGRREALGLIAGAGGLLAASAVAAQSRDPLAGKAMIEDVRAYDRLGEHRTGTEGDDSTSQWLKRRLDQAGLAAGLQAFDSQLFAPTQCRIDLGGPAIAAFPGWPVAPTPPAGVTAPLAAHDAPSLAGRIAVVRLPYSPGGSWAAPGCGAAVMAAIQRGPIAVVAVTEGPTGEIIALNAVPRRFTWPVPVVIAAGRDGDRLSQAAAAGATARLVSTGRQAPLATAANVIARRPGRGKTIVVSTPKSGWFHCAGERGTGIAVFLALAHWLVRQSQADLIFACLSGHELDEVGAAHFLRTAAPAPDQLRVWFHIGANAAMQGLSIQDSAVVARPRSGPDRRVTVSHALLPAAQTAFTALADYLPPWPLDPASAVGDLSIFNTAGYAALVGLLGPSPLFHTRLDRAEACTTPADLAAVAGASQNFLRAFA